MGSYQNILIIGLGNMAGAMLEGWLASGLDAQCFTAVDPVRSAAPDGVQLLRELPADGHFDLVLIGVKPQMLDDLAPSIERIAGPQTTVLSILAGTQLAALAAHFPRAGAIVRMMPNLAAALGLSASTLFARDLDQNAREAMTALTARLGGAEWLDSEEQFHAVTALAGSGPGFVYRFIESLSLGGQALGLDPRMSQRLATQMLQGASALAASSDAGPAELADRVASPGGTTQAGLDVLDNGDALRRLVAECLRSASDRSREMAEKPDKKG